MPSSGDLDLPPFDPELAFREQLNRERIGSVLLPQNPRGESLFGVSFFHPDSSLEDDRSGVDLGRDEVHCAPGDLRTIVYGLLLGVQTGKAREQRGVYVHQPPLKVCHEFGTENPVEAREENQAGILGDIPQSERFDQFRVVLLPCSGVLRTLYYRGMDSQLVSDLEGLDTRPVAEYEPDVGVGDEAAPHRLEDRFEVRASTRDENPDGNQSPFISFLVTNFGVMPSFE